jgi:serine/threonine protein kinase/tetratricopeptide (TPR) repeat protein
MDSSERPLSSQTSGPGPGELRQDGESRAEAKSQKDGERNPTAAEVPLDRSVSETTRFRVVSLHASGGMGHVFVAQDDQLKRSVALKEIQERFADDRQIRDRFLREAEVTGQLEHPGIVPVYALGHYDDGRPYYVMRMIRGESLKRAIATLHRLRDDEHAFRLELRRLLNRFVTACNTLEYAHSRGVVHRDIKPDNILLGPYGETLVVDWGLAKLISTSEVRTDIPGSDSVRQSPVDATQYGTVAGTPSYMSPEQALGWQDAITRVSDVYSLGATLYSLLTGRPSVTGEGLSDLIVRIQKQDYPKPREINPSIPRSLEAICLKAMAPSMSARYVTADALASDLEAFLAGEPVSAWKEPLSVRAARWIRRHRTLVTTAATTAAVLIVALTVIVGLQTSANLRLTAANNRETIARQEAEAERDKAQKNFQMAQDAVDRYFTQVSEDRRLAAHGLEPLRRDLLRSAGQFYERFVKQDQKAVLRYDNAWAKFRLASINDEIAPPAEAIASYEQAAQTFRDLSQTEGPLGQASRDGLLMCTINLSNLYDRIGQRLKGQATLAEALELAQSLLKQYPNSAPIQNHLGRCFGMQGSRALDAGDLAQARKAYGDEIRVREQIVASQNKQTYQLELAGAYRNLAIVEERSEHLADAHHLLDQSVSLDRKLVRENADDGFLQHTLAQSLAQLGDLEAREGRDDEARRTYREAVEIRGTLVERHPDVLEYRAALAVTADNLGVFCFDRGELDAAQTYYQQALIQAERLATDYPKMADYQGTWATSLANAAMLALTRGRQSLAEQWLKQALEIRKQFQHDFPKALDALEGFASASLGLAILETDTKRLQQGEQHLGPAIDAFRQLAAAHPDRPFYTERLGVGLKLRGDLLKAAQRNDDAVAAYHEAQQLQRHLVSAHPAVIKHRMDLAMTCINLGNLCGRQGQAAAAASAFEEVLQLFPESSRASLGSQARSFVGTAYTGRAFARESRGDLDGMARDFEAAIALAPPARARMLRLKCTTFLSADGQKDRALAMADPLLKDADLDGPSAFELALLYLGSANPAKVEQGAGPAQETARTALVLRRIEQAISLLQRAKEAHFFADPSNRKKLHGAPFVPLLSGNATFQKLLLAVEKESSVRLPAAAK